MLLNLFQNKYKFLLLILLNFLFTSCYTIKQSYYQVKLLLSRENIQKIIDENKETPERINKLKLVMSVKEYAKNKLLLNNENNYEYFISLNDSVLSWLVQGAEIRSLTMKTWWFPFIGHQPYLGFFAKQDALDFKLKLEKKGFDTKISGVVAFSLLGYFSDPLYSSMIDNVDNANIIETIIHESVHATIYIPNFASFNENLADFYAKKGTELYLNEHTEIVSNIEQKKTQLEILKRTFIAKDKFKSFLEKTRKTLTTFYDLASKDKNLQDDILFLQKRQEIFDKISYDYKNHMNGDEKNTWYEFAFTKGQFNNATFLSYSLYEEYQNPFESVYENNNKNLIKMLKNIQKCIKKEFKNETELWEIISTCKD